MAPPPPGEGDEVAALTALHHEVATIAESFGAELPESLHDELESVEQQVFRPLCAFVPVCLCASVLPSVRPSLPPSVRPFPQPMAPSVVANRWSTCWSFRRSSRRTERERQAQRRKQGGSRIAPSQAVSRTQPRWQLSV